MTEKCAKATLMLNYFIYDTSLSINLCTKTVKLLTSRATAEELPYTEYECNESKLCYKATENNCRLYDAAASAQSARHEVLRI
jgi:hypothetical protein